MKLPGAMKNADSDVKDYDTKGRIVTQQNDNCQSKKTEHSALTKLINEIHQTSFLYLNSLSNSEGVGCSTILACAKKI